uniref:Ig-like domain-containing protein n=1 Tax=Myripristis murdjan TaxID=586833 RepID=A0A667YUL5_9TELE
VTLDCNKKLSSGVVLECESKGWYPEPELFWLDAEGKLLSAGAPETVRGPDGLYTVSSRVTVEKSHSNSFTCRVQQSKIHSRKWKPRAPTGDGASGESQLIGPTQPIVAMIGHDVILPCHLDPAEDATAMTVEWARPDLEPRFVHVLRDGLELDEKKYHLYMGRTSLLNNQLKHGDVSLKLATVKLSDEGKYKCFIPTLSKETFIDLVVGAASSPVLTINKDTSAVVLDCESKGWHPKPELFWLDAEGKLLSAGAPETVRGPDGLYTVSNSVAVEKSHSNSYTCRVQQHKIQQTRETQIHLEGEQYSKHMTLAFELL